MATFSFDVFGAPLMERDFPLINAAYVDGQFLCTGTTDGTNIGTLKSGAGLYVNFVGVLCAGATTTDGTQSGRNVDEARVIFNPGGVYLCEYDLSTGIAVASVDGTTNAESDPVITVGDGKGHPNLGGGWIYRNVDAGAGELDAVLSSLVSGTANLITLSQVAAALPTTDSYLCPIYPPFTQYGIDITATKIDCTDLDSDGGTLGTDGMSVSMLDTWITYNSVPLQRLRASKHEHLTNLDGLGGLHIYSEVCFAPSHYLINPT